MENSFNEKDINKRIRTIRKSLLMSLSELAKRINMSKAYISKLENSEKAPPISTLVKISKAMGVDLNYLITGKTEDKDVSFVKAEDAILVPNKAKGSFGYEYFVIAHGFSSKLMEPFKLVINNENKKIPSSYFSHPGQEMNYLIEGEAEIIIDNKVYRMKKGDTIYFNSILPHYLKSVGEEKAVFVSVNVSSEKDIKENEKDEKRDLS